MAEKSKAWHLWAGTGDRMNCMVNNVHSWVILSVGGETNKSIGLQIHNDDGSDLGKDALAKMYTVLVHHLQAKGIIPALPAPLPPEPIQTEAAKPEESASVTTVDILLPEKTR